jgi:large subunit ribosomal protein L9
VAEELVKQGFQIERKRIELAGNSFKSVGKYKVTVKLYESAAAEISVTVVGQEIKTETHSPARPPRRRRDAAPEGAGAASPGGTLGEAAREVPPEGSPAEAALAGESPVPAGEPVPAGTVDGETPSGA